MILQIPNHVVQVLTDAEATGNLREVLATETIADELARCVREALAPKEKTTPELVDMLRLPGDQSVIVRNGQRGQLTSALKAQFISTRQKRLEDGSYLFTRCEARKFKP